MKAGYWVTNHKENPKKKTTFTGPVKDEGDHHTMSVKDKKAYYLASKF